MMSRRRFLQITVSMAVAAAMSPLPGQRRDLEPSDIHTGPDLWIPTVPEVAEWLEYYKLSMASTHHRFTDIVLGLGTSAEEVGILLKEFGTAERDFERLTAARLRVAYTQESGYAAGRSGEPRRNAAFLQKSHEGFGWFNYWAIGDYDRRRELGLPRLGRTLEEEYSLQGTPAQPLVQMLIERFRA